jgi:uncharacterized membrane-anchored protein
MKKYKWYLLVFNLLLLLIYFNNSIFNKERILKKGKFVLLELAPVDPRSLMQGDYMSLRYKLSEEITFEKIPRRGYCVVTLDKNKIAKRVRFQSKKVPLSKGELLIEYSSPNSWEVNIGAESYFFEEGKAKKFEKAKYGGLKIDNEGNSLLIGLYDKNRIKIK